MNRDRLQTRSSLNISDFFTKQSTNERDVYSTHRTEEIKKYSQGNGIALQYIPSGQTGELPPLYFRIFLSLKQRARIAFTQNNIITMEENQPTIDWEHSINLLIQCFEDSSR